MFTFDSNLVVNYIYNNIDHSLKRLLRIILNFNHNMLLGIHYSKCDNSTLFIKENFQNE